MDANANFKVRKPSSVLFALRDDGALVDESGGWLTVQPLAEKKRVDRRALGVMLRQIDKDGCLRLMPECDFAATLDGDTMPRIVSDAVDAVMPGARDAADFNDLFPTRGPTVPPPG